MATRYTLDLDVPIETAFDVVEDPEKIKLWAEGVEEIIYPDGRDEQNPVGTRFKQRIREGGRVEEYEGVVTAYDRPRHLGISLGNKQFTVAVEYRFTPISASSTRLDFSDELTYHTPIARLMGTLFGWFANRILRKQMKKLKAVAESGTPGRVT